MHAEPRKVFLLLFVGKKRGSVYLPGYKTPKILLRMRRWPSLLAHPLSVFFFMLVINNFEVINVFQFLNSCSQRNLNLQRNWGTNVQLVYWVN